MKKDAIGTNAGAVWRALNAHYNDKMTLEELARATRLDTIDLACAIGWLAREDKVRFLKENGKDYFSVYQECYY